MAQIEDFSGPRNHPAWTLGEAEALSLPLATAGPCIGEVAEVDQLMTLRQPFTSQASVALLESACGEQIQQHATDPSPDLFSRDHSLSTGVPLESMSAPIFNTPRTCVAQRDKKRSLLQRISQRVKPIDVGYRCSIVGPNQDMMSLQEREEASQGKKDR